MDGVIEPEVVGGPTLEDAFGLALKKKSPTRALVQRLVDGTLKPAELAQLTKTREIRRRQLLREPLPVIATALDMTPQNLRSYMAGQHFRVMMRWLAEQEQKPESLQARSKREEERAQWNALAPKALEFYETAFKKDEDGEYVDPDRAERAAKLIADGQGWTEPEPPAPKVQELKLGVIQAQMAAIAAVDRGETVVRVQVEVSHHQTTPEGEHRGEL